MNSSLQKRLSTGVAGLDEILHGGLVPGRTYLIRGAPGTGKTILGLHYLTADDPGNSLFISLSEPVEMIRDMAERLSIHLDGVTFLDLTPEAELFTAEQTYDIFSPAEVERGPTTQVLVEKVLELRPERIFIDAITQLRYLTNDDIEFRRHVFSLLRFLREEGATVLFTSEAGKQVDDDDLQFLSDGIIQLGRDEVRREISVLKLRGSDFHAGRHALKISAHGLTVYPRLLPEVHAREFVREAISSGVTELDDLLHGGLERGTVTLITGPGGVGKTTLGMHFMKEAARHGERSVIYLFEESMKTLLHRSESIGIPINEMLDEGALSLVPVEPLKLTPEEFAQIVREEVEAREARIVMLDNISGYRLSVRGENLIVHIHDLTRYLRNMGVTLILINDTEVISGPLRVTELGFSYLADNVLFLRYLELHGELFKAIGVLKKRASDFEKTLRRLHITEAGMQLGDPLSDVRGILFGATEWISREGNRAEEDDE